MDEWDTPDSLLQKIAVFGLPGIWDTIDWIAEGNHPSTIQDPTSGFDASYEALYPWSWVDWAGDTNEMLHRKFQVFRGQAHRMVLKAMVNGTALEILD